MVYLPYYDFPQNDEMANKLAEFGITPVPDRYEAEVTLLKGTADNIVRFAEWMHYNVDCCPHSFNEEEVLDGLENWED